MDEPWMFCFHSSGNEPGCVGCWYGSYQRANKENQELRRGIKDAGFEVLTGSFLRFDGDVSAVIIIPSDRKKIAQQLMLLL